MRVHQGTSPIFIHVQKRERERDGSVNVIFLANRVTHLPAVPVMLANDEISQKMAAECRY